VAALVGNTATTVGSGGVAVLATGLLLRGVGDNTATTVRVAVLLLVALG